MSVRVIRAQTLCRLILLQPARTDDPLGPMRSETPRPVWTFCDLQGAAALSELALVSLHCGSSHLPERAPLFVSPSELLHNPATLPLTRLMADAVALQGAPPYPLQARGDGETHPVLSRLTVTGGASYAHLTHHMLATSYPR
eukprot:COSAG05_NODE_1909_length_3846_cov_3.179610_1_plen_142_part_00